MPLRRCLIESSRKSLKQNQIILFGTACLGLDEGHDGVTSNECGCTPFNGGGVPEEFKDPLFGSVAAVGCNISIETATKNLAVVVDR